MNEDLDHFRARLRLMPDDEVVQAHDTARLNADQGRVKVAAHEMKRRGMNP